MDAPVELPVFWRSHSPHEIGPRPLKLDIPGWAGTKDHGNGAKPQPWHCQPWVEGNTYGLELVFPWEDFRISTVDGKLVVEGSDERLNGHVPFQMFAPGHYGYGSGLDIYSPGHIIRLEPHPQYFTDTTGTVPLLVPGHLQTEWWTRTFFIVFKAPAEGQTHIFRKGKGYGQVILLPYKTKYALSEMSEADREKRVRWERITYYYDSQIGPKSWTANDGHNFNDKYKVMSRAWRQGGEEAIEQLFSKAAWRAEVEKKPQPKRSTIKRRLVKKGKP